MSALKSVRKEVVGVVGLGTMGLGIAQLMATQGHETLIFDAIDNVRAKGKGGIEKNLAKLKERGRITDLEERAIQNRVKTVDSLTQLSRCHIIIEAIYEEQKNWLYI